MAVAFAIQSRITAFLTAAGHRRVGHYWTPHSGRNLMPGASAAMGRSRSDRDLLGGWGAEGSERYSWWQSTWIALLQREVAATLQRTDHPGSSGQI